MLHSVKQFGGSPVIRLYQLRTCPWAGVVRRELDALGLPYEEIQVPGRLGERDEVERLSGQRLTPVIVDEERVVSDSATIVRYLRERYGNGAAQEAAEAPAPAACALRRAA
jgi:glutathione S-transferase